MIPYNVPINAQRMTIGVQGENNVREFLFDVTEWRNLTGDIGAAEMVVQRAGDSSPYATVITMKDENTVSWVPSEVDTAKAGAGKIELMWIANNHTIKTKIFLMKVDPSLPYAVPDDSLNPWASWMPGIINADAKYKGLADRVDVIQENLTSPYNFRGALASAAALPAASATNANDTYYLIEEKYRVTSTGEEWAQSSMSESDYTDILTRTAALTGRTANIEETPTASKDYTVDDLILYTYRNFNILFKVITPISAGDTLASGSNVTNLGNQKTVATALSERMTGLADRTDALEASIGTMDVNLCCLENPSVYARARVLNGTVVSVESNAVTFRTGTESSFNGILFSASTTPLSAVDRPYAADGFVAEFDISFVGDAPETPVTFRAVDPDGWKLEQAVTSGHNKIVFDLQQTNFVYFYRVNGEAEIEFSVSNLIVYQGRKTDNPYAFAARDRSSAPQRNKLFTIGDSLTNISGDANRGQERWQTYVINRCNFKSFSAAGGVGYTVALKDGQTSILERVMALEADDDVDMVTFWGGTNDWSQGIEIGDLVQNLDNPNNNTFYGALISCVRKLMTLYPDKPMLMIGTIPRMKYESIGDWSTKGAVNGRGNTLMDFNAAVKAVAKRYSLPFIDLMYEAGINDLNYAEYLVRQTYDDITYYYLHLTDFGEVRVGNVLAGRVAAMLGC